MLCLVMIQPVFASYFIPVPENDLQNVTNSAVEEYRQLSTKERKNRIKAAKEEIKTHRQNGAADERTLLLVILAILLPPLAVYLHQGEINSKFWISLILTLIFWLPGMIYSLLVVLGEV
jgi:uncharacterized membrane protein YqaE (UPF0057 family)